MEAKVYDLTGKQTGSVALSEAVFGLELNSDLVHRALLLQLSNARINIAHTKTRSDRQGSTRKLYKQKGTGRARAGSARSPVRRKGGVAFGPRNNQNFTIMMNKKERQKALFCVLSSKVSSNALVVVNKFHADEISTKKMNAALSTLPLGKTTLVALSEKNEAVEKSLSNLKLVKTIQSSYLNIADLLKYETLVLSEDAVKNLNAMVA